MTVSQIKEVRIHSEVEVIIFKRQPEKLKILGLAKAKTMCYICYRQVVGRGADYESCKGCARAKE